MAKKEIEIYEGKVKWEYSSSLFDNNERLYIEDDRVESILDSYTGKTVRVTIEVIEDD